jgi:diadenosine tetraphosphate (Ap4A) HIT family hydrolase
MIPIPGGAIYEDELLYAGHGGPGYLGYLFVEPKRHVPGWADLTDKEAQALGLLVARLSRALKQSEGPEKTTKAKLGFPFQRIPF